MREIISIVTDFILKIFSTKLRDKNKVHMKLNKKKPCLHFCKVYFWEDVTEKVCSFFFYGKINFLIA